MAVTIIRNGTVLPMAGSDPAAARTVLEASSVLFDGDTISAIGPVAEIDAHRLASGAEIIDASGMVVLPGLHNCHMHSGLLRGTAESMSLWDWLHAYVDPAHKVMTPEIAAAASLVAYTENVRFGNTSVLDMWRFMEGSAAAADRVGIRATLAPYVADEPGYDYFETLDTNLALLKSHRSASDGRVRAWVGLEHLLYCTPQCFRDAMALAEEYDCGLHTHSSETIWEVQESLKRFGRRPIEEFYNRGVLSERTVVAHAVWLDDREIQLMAQTGTSAVHCPCSNMKLASGPARVRDMRAAGIAFGLGSDGEKENNNLDLFEEMKFASLLQKVTALDPTIGDPWDILTMATIEGAKALGLDAITGSLAVGKRADIVMVDLRSIKFVPTFGNTGVRGATSNVAAHLVFTANGDDVDSVWVDGIRLVAGRKIISVDEASVMAQGQAAAEELFERRVAIV